MKYLFLLLFIPIISQAQQTYVPDDNFEAYLEANGMGNGIANDDYVTTANITGVVSLYIGALNISDLTGIEDFSSLGNLQCYDNLLTSIDLTQNTALVSLGIGNNQLASLDISQNTSLLDLQCGGNQITNLDVTQNIALIYLFCGNNLLTSLDVSQNTSLLELQCVNMSISSLDLTQNTSLTHLTCLNNPITSLDLTQNTLLTHLTCTSNLLSSLDLSLNTNLKSLYCGGNSLTTLPLSQNTLLEALYCGYNQLTSLDLSQNASLQHLHCPQNQLECLNLKNGNNIILSYLEATDNPNLSCIEVDDVTWSTSNWFNIDAQTTFSENCNNACSNNVGISEILPNAKKVVKITDLFGRETEDIPNTILIYIYSDGTTEKVYRME